MACTETIYLNKEDFKRLSEINQLLNGKYNTTVHSHITRENYAITLEGYENYVKECKFDLLYLLGR